MKKFFVGLFLILFCLGCGEGVETIQQQSAESQEAECDLESQEAECDLVRTLPGNTYTGEIWCGVVGDRFSTALLDQCFSSEEECQKRYGSKGCVEQSVGYVVDHALDHFWCRPGGISYTVFASRSLCETYLRSAHRTSALLPDLSYSFVYSRCYRVTREVDGDVEKAIREAVLEARSEWVYYDYADELTGVVRKVARLTSLPARERLAVLSLSKKSGRYSVGLWTSQDDIVRCNTYSGCSLQVKFDDKLVTFSATSNPDGKSVWLSSSKQAQRFIENLTKSKVFAVRLPLYSKGSPVFEFSVSKFDPSEIGFRPTPVRRPRKVQQRVPDIGQQRVPDIGWALY